MWPWYTYKIRNANYDTRRVIISIKVIMSRVGHGMGDFPGMQPKT